MLHFGPSTFTWEIYRNTYAVSRHHLLGIIWRISPRYLLSVILFTANWLSFSAWRCHSGLLSERVWKGGNSRSSHTSSAWAHACNLAVAPWWWIYGCIWKWHCNLVSGWHLPPCIPSFFYLLSRLSWKVCTSCKDTTIKSNIFHRVLLASIRYLGTHPCPRCLVEKCDIRKFGSKADLKRREKLVRIDDGPRQFDVETARKLIYTQGIPVNSDRITAILGPKSLVPTRVSLRQVPAQFQVFLTKICL